MYPIYEFKLKFAVPTYKPEWAELLEGLPEGLQWDHTSGYKMYREELTPEEEQQELQSFRESFLSKREDIPEYIEDSVELVRYDEWCLTWFSHYTFDNGQSDKEVLESFQNYVWQVEKHNRDIRWETGKEFSTGSIPLMGAEDRWRWSGTKDGTTDTKTDAPCRCEHCKARGVITINH